MGGEAFWREVYLGCFLVGALATVGFFLLGAGHHGHGGHVGHGGHGGHGAHGPKLAATGIDGVVGLLASLLNLGSLLGLLLAGGAGGYTALRLGASLARGFAIALAAGLVGALLIALATRLLARAEAGVVKPFDATGIDARTIAAITSGAVGEIVFTRDGARAAMPARLDGDSDGTRAIGKNEEVVVMRVERGVAYVRRASDLVGREESK